MRFYVNDYLFEISPKSEVEKKNTAHASIFSAATAGQVIEHYKLVKAGNVQGSTAFIFLVSDYEAVCQEVKSFFKIIEAAGGIVQKDHQLLLIFRLLKWDLPKGKMEAGEQPATTAVREVEEECGLKTKIVKKIGETWHTYELKGKQILKCTHWYLMKSTSEQAPVPQAEEAIEQVKWIDKEEAEKLLKSNSYASILDILEQFKAM